MNHIVKKRTWLSIRTGALIFGLAIAAGACQREGTEETSNAPPGTPGAEERGAKPIRDVDSIVGAADRAANVNRQADLTNVEVQRVPTESDRVFWVGTTADRAVPVYLDDEAHKALLAAQEHVEAGDKVTIVGEIKRVPSADDLQKNWKLTAQDAEQFHRAQVYIHVKKLTFAEQPAQPNQPAQPGQPGQPAGQPPAQPGQPGQQPGQPPAQPGQPGQQPGQPGQQPGQPGQPGQ